MLPNDIFYWCIITLHAIPFVSKPSIMTFFLCKCVIKLFFCSSFFMTYLLCGGSISLQQESPMWLCKWHFVHSGTAQMYYLWECQFKNGGCSVWHVLAGPTENIISQDLLPLRIMHQQESSFWAASSRLVRRPINSAIISHAVLPCTTLTKYPWRIGEE